MLLVSLPALGLVPVLSPSLSLSLHARKESTAIAIARIAIPTCRFTKLCTPLGACFKLS